MKKNNFLSIMFIVFFFRGVITAHADEMVLSLASLLIRWH